MLKIGEPGNKATLLPCISKSFFPFLLLGWWWRDGRWVWGALSSVFWSGWPGQAWSDKETGDEDTQPAWPHREGWAAETTVKEFTMVSGSKWIAIIHMHSHNYRSPHAHVHVSCTLYMYNHLCLQFGHGIYYMVQMMIFRWSFVLCTYVCVIVRHGIYLI